METESSTKGPTSTSVGPTRHAFYRRPLDEQYQCQWCETKFVVPSLTQMHEERCEYRDVLPEEALDQ